MANLTKIILFHFLVLAQLYVYKPADDAFTVQFPGDYSLTQDTISTDLGKIPISMAHFNCKADPLCSKKDTFSIYAITHMDYPEASFDRDSLDWIENFIGESIENRRQEIGPQTELLYLADIEEEHYSGSLVRFSNPENGMQCKGKFIILDNRFILIQVISNKTHITSSQTDHFLNSFTTNVD